MENNCAECGGRRINAEVLPVRLDVFSPGGNHNKTFPAKVKICRQCGRMTYYLTQPQELAEWIDSL